MLTDLLKYTISKNATLIEALRKLNEIPKYLVLFIIDDENKLIGSLTDGDIRRSIIKGASISDTLDKLYNTKFSYLKQESFSQEDINVAKARDINILPIVDGDNQIVKIINFKKIKTILPIDAVIMAGGIGARLRPLTESIPKPLLNIGGKPIIEYNIDRLGQYGIQNQYLSIKYLGDLIKDFCNNKEGDFNFKFVEEDQPLGTIGAVSLIDDFQHDYILVMNSDLLTNIDYADIYKSLKDKNADIIVASVPYDVNLPYAILETEKRKVKSFKEKPSYTYFANAGIYIFKKEILRLIPRNQNFNATDLMQSVIDKGLNLVHYPIRSYWLDIGKPDDFEKAQKDIAHINWD